MSLLRCRDLRKSFGGVHAVDGVSLEVHSGELLGLIGPNGAGKSTLFNLLNGQLRPDGGHIEFAGVSLVGLAPRDIWALGVGRSFQMAQTFGSLSVLENVQTVLLSRARRLGRFWQRAASFQVDQAMALLAQVGVAQQAQRVCGELAYGDVKRVELALALASEPTLLLMDEPTAGMAPQERHALMALTRELASQRGMAVLFTEHSLEVVFGYAQRVIVLARGRVIAQGDAQQVQAHPEVQEVYLGSRHVPVLARAKEASR